MATTKGKIGDAAKARQARSRELDKQYRANAAKLKKLGILTERVNARKNITRATRTKINRFRDVLEGRAIAVKAPREVLEAYRDRGTLEVRGKGETARVVVPKEFANQRASISRGMVKVTRPLKNGTEEYVILPWRANDLYDLVEKLKTDPDALDELKLADEYFSFRLYGHNASDSFEDADALRRNLEHYLSRLGGKKNVIKHITFQRFKANPTDMGRSPFEGAEYKVPYDTNHERRKRGKGTYELRRDAARAARKAKQRANETEDQRNERLRRQRIRQAQHRQRQFEGQ